MFSILKLSISPLVQFDINALQYPPHYQVNNYQVTCSSQQHIHPVKRDKAKASMTAKERSDLWKRFQNIDMVEYQDQYKATQIVNSSLSYVRLPKIDGNTPLSNPVYADYDIPRPHPVSTDYDIPRPHPDYADYDIPRSYPVSADYNIPRPHSAYADYDIPRPNPVSTNFDIPHSHPDYADYDIPRSYSLIPMNNHNRAKHPL